MPTSKDRKDSAAVLLDVDGTLIDSSYHMALSWDRAFVSEDLFCEMWRIHRAIGMGGDHLVAHLFDQQTEDRVGDKLRKRWEKEYLKVADEVRAFDGAHELVVRLREQGFRVALASSSPKELNKRALKMLDLTEDDFDAVTTASDAENSKPDPDIFAVALEKAGGGRAVVIGDSVWDVKAAKGIDAPTLAVRSGGFGVDELMDAGAKQVVETVKDLLDADWDELTGR